MGDASRPSVPPLALLKPDGDQKKEEGAEDLSVNNVNVNNTDERPSRRSIDVSMIKFPADVQDQLDNFDATYRRDPTDYKNLIDWGTCLSKYGASVLKNLKSMMKKSKEKNRLQWIETKEILFMACVKFQESYKLSPDQITLLEQWGDTLLLISTNYLVPLHELACEKFMQALTLNPNSSVLHAKYGVSLSKRAYYHQKQMFAIAGAKGVMPVNLTKPGTNQIWTPRELYNLADSHFNKAVTLEPAEPKNWIYWAKSLHIRLEFARDSQAAIVLGNEISARYHQALAANENDSKVLQLWAKSIDLTIERYIVLAPYPEDKGQQDYLAAMLEFYLHCFQSFADTHPVPIKPLIAFAMLDDDKINQIAYQALREISRSCRNESNKIEAARNVTFLDTIYKTRYEINQSNRQKALETLDALPDKARSQVSKQPLTDLDLMAIGQYYDIFLNCVHFSLRRILVEEMEHDTKANKFYAFLKRRNQALKSMTNIALERKDLQLINNNNNVNVNNADDPNEPPSPREGDRSISASMNSYNSQMSDQMSGTNQSLGLRGRRHSVIARPANGSTSLANGKSSPGGENTPTGPHTGTGTGLGPRERRNSEPVRPPSIDIEKIFKLEDPSLIYKHRQLIGKGGFGKVYISKEKVSKKTYRQVALKVSKNKIETQHQLQSVAHEINALRACKHRNIVNLLDAYMWNGHAWMVMEYCDGGALSTLLKDVVLNEQEISYIVRQITEGLHYLHSQKRVHRDIKADNILLNLNGEVKLADLGLVEELEEEPTTTSSTNDSIEDNRRDLTKQHNLGMAGSCYWMAPEIIKRQQFGSKVDIWSLGCVLYELIAQEPPYHGLGPLMAMFRTTTKGPPSLKDPRKWSDNLMDFLHLCWEVNPRNRPSAGALLEHPFFHQSYTFNTLSLTKKLETVFLDDVLRKGGMI